MVCVSVCIGVLKHTLTVGGLGKVTSDRAGVGDGGRKGLSLSLSCLMYIFKVLV